MTSTSNKKSLNLLVLLLSATVTLTLAVSTMVNAAIEIEPEIQVSGTTVSTGDNHVGESKIAKDQYGNSVVVWTATDTGGNGRIFFRIYDDKGSPITTATEAVTAQTGYQRTPDVAMDQDGNFFITWEVSGTSNDTLGIWLAVFNPSGTQVDNRELVQASATEPSIASQFEREGTNTRIAISYTSTITSEDIEYSVYDIDYNIILDQNIYFIREVTVTNSTGDQKYSDIAMNNAKDVALTWNDNNATLIRYKIYDNTGAELFAEGSASETTVSTSARTAVSADKAPAALNLTKRFAIAYDGTFDTGGTFNGIGIRTINCPYLGSCTLDTTSYIANTDATTIPAYPEIASDYLGNFTVVWENPTTGLDIKGQSFKYDGKNIGENFDVNTSITTGYQRYPSIGMNDSGEYNIAFSDQNSTNVHQTEYTTEIFKITTETVVNTTTTGQQDSASTDISENSTIVTTWKDTSDNTIKFTLKDISGTVIKAETVVATGVTASNPQVTFFKDAIGSPYIDYFIIVWEETGAVDTDIFFRTYDSTGTPVSPAATETVLNQTTTGIQNSPDIAAGYFPIFTSAWQDATDIIIATYYDGTSFFEQTVATCSAIYPCTNVTTALNQTNNETVYAWEITADGITDIFAQQAKYDDSALILQGSNFQVDSTKNGILPDTAFTANDQFLITYTTDTGTQSIWTSRFDFALGSTPTLLDEFEVTPSTHQTNPTNSKIVSDLTNGDILIVWYDTPETPLLDTDDNIYGLFYEYQSAVLPPTQYGPIFQINSTISNYQLLPSVGMNSGGHITVAWEGNIDQPAQTDTYGIANQILHSPFITLTAGELAAICEQQVTTGVRTLTVPNTIYFPILDVSTTEEQTNQISIRATDDASCGGICGGDIIKYIEVTDESGADFDLTVTASDFISASDQKTYIKADQHFKVRNYDQITSDDLTADCGIDPEMCFAIIQCSIPEVTTFRLDPSTENFVTMDQNRTLATKRGTTNNPAEVGAWRFYPEFELTIPKIIPAGEHAGTITFTIN